MKMAADSVDAPRKPQILKKNVSQVKNEKARNRFSDSLLLVKTVRLLVDQGQCRGQVFELGCDKCFDITPCACSIDANGSDTPIYC
jgi:hypothetical protein